MAGFCTKEVWFYAEHTSSDVLQSEKARHLPFGGEFVYLLRIEVVNEYFVSEAGRPREDQLKPPFKLNIESSISLACLLH